MCRRHVLHRRPGCRSLGSSAADPTAHRRDEARRPQWPTTTTTSTRVTSSTRVTTSTPPGAAATSPRARAPRGRAPRGRAPRGRAPRGRAPRRAPAASTPRPGASRTPRQAKRAAISTHPATTRTPR
ncbi:hypothetical protein C5D18_05455 [Rathayibacter tritici]|nr:hypothetical protein C5D18_05455 [Rathayibacter tritici]